MPKIVESEFIIFDVETTGLSPRWGDRIVEIAALKIKNLKIIERFETLVNPEREISYGAFRVNGITQSMVQDAPKAVKVLPDFLEFMGEGCLVGHNVNFDLGFLHQELSLAGHSSLMGKMALDTIRMAKGFLPPLPSYSLSSLVYALSLDRQQTHRAMSDVELTLQVFLHLVKVAQQRNVDNLEQLVRLFGYRLGKR